MTNKKARFVKKGDIYKYSTPVLGRKGWVALDDAQIWFEHNEMLLNEWMVRFRVKYFPTGTIDILNWPTERVIKMSEDLFVTEEMWEE